MLLPTIVKNHANVLVLSGKGQRRVGAVKDREESTQTQIWTQKEMMQT